MPLCPAARHRPADRMPGDLQQQPRSSRPLELQRCDRVRRNAREQRSSPLGAQPRVRKPVCRPHRPHPEPSHCNRTARWTKRPHCPRRYPAPVAHKRRHQPAIRAPIHAQPLGSHAHIALKHSRAAVVERMRHRIARVNPLQPVIRERQRAQVRRTSGKRVNRRAYIVQEPRQSQFLGARAASGCVRSLQNKHAAPHLRDRYRRRKPVRTRPHDYHIISATAVRHSPSLAPAMAD